MYKNMLMAASIFLAFLAGMVLIGAPLLAIIFMTIVSSLMFFFAWTNGDFEPGKRHMSRRDEAAEAYREAGEREGFDVVDARLEEFRKTQSPLERWITWF